MKVRVRDSIPLVVFYTSWPEFKGESFNWIRFVAFFDPSSFQNKKKSRKTEFSRPWSFYRRLSSSNSSGSNRNRQWAIKNNFTKADKIKNVLSIFEAIFMIYRLWSWIILQIFFEWRLFCLRHNADQLFIYLKRDEN